MDTPPSSDALVASRPLKTYRYNSVVSVNVIGPKAIFWMACGHKVDNPTTHLDCEDAPFGVDLTDQEDDENEHQDKKPRVEEKPHHGNLTLENLVQAVNAYQATVPPPASPDEATTVRRLALHYADVAQEQANACRRMFGSRAEIHKEREDALANTVFCHECGEIGRAS